MLSYNGVNMELVSIDRFEREGESSSDGVDRLWNQYTIQVTAVVHYAYLNRGASPTLTNNDLKVLLLQKRKKFKFSFVTGGAGSHGNDIPLAPAFSEVGADGSFIFDGPLPADLHQTTIVPDHMQPVGDRDAEVGDVEVLIESPPGDAPVDAHLGPDPLFCHITEFAGANGFVVTWAVRTWLVECFTQIDNLSSLVDNRFVMIHDVNDNQVATVTTYGEAIFRTDLLLLRKQLPDNFRGVILAPVYRGFRRSHIQVKQMSDTTVRYMTIDTQTPVVFDPSVPWAIRAEVLNRRVLARKDALADSAFGALNSYYSYTVNRNWATESADNQKRADEIHKEKLKSEKAKQQFFQQKTKPKFKP